MPETQLADLRRYRRANILCPVTLCREGTLERFEATGLNEGGLLVLSRMPIEIESEFHLIIELPDSQVVEAEGKVCSTSPQVGLGVRFTAIEPRYRERISRAVRAALSEADAAPDGPPSPEQAEKWKKLRSEPRIAVSFEVVIEGRDETGEVFTERGKVYDVSRHGAAVWVRRHYELDQPIRLFGPERKFTAPAIVRNLTREGGQWRIGLRLLSVPEAWVIR